MNLPDGNGVSMGCDWGFNGDLMGLNWSQLKRSKSHGCNDYLLDVRKTHIYIYIYTDMTTYFGGKISKPI